MDLCAQVKKKKQLRPLAFYLECFLMPNNCYATSVLITTQSSSSSWNKIGRKQPFLSGCKSPGSLLPLSGFPAHQCSSELCRARCLLPDFPSLYHATKYGFANVGQFRFVSPENKSLFQSFSSFPCYSKHMFTGVLQAHQIIPYRLFPLHKTVPSCLP